MGNTFQERAGTPGYDKTGRAEPGLAGSQVRDEARRGANDERNIMRAAQQNAKRALRAGDMAEWEKWSTVAGGRTFGAIDSEQAKRESVARNHRNVEDAANLRGGVAKQPQEGLGNGAAGAGLGNGAAGGGLGNGAAGGGLNGNKQNESNANQATQTGVDKAANPDAPSNPVSEARNILNQYGSGKLDRNAAIASGMLIEGATEEGINAELDKLDSKKTDLEDRRYQADVLKEAYKRGQITKDEFQEKGLAIKGATKESLDEASSLIESEKSKEKGKTNVAAEAQAKEALRQKNNAEILGKARAEGRLAPVEESKQATKGSTWAEMDGVFNDPKFDAQQKEFTDQRASLEKESKAALSADLNKIEESYASKKEQRDREAMIRNARNDPYKKSKYLREFINPEERVAKEMAKQDEARREAAQASEKISSIWKSFKTGSWLGFGSTQG